ncbi:MAG: transketolase [Candidatus Thermoplasmatota archaeon]|nr:transketolase [Candidatus Thermoplasmatota archaeon]MCL5793623.1 transketolase [Candidatus Thermoplasmatota archaeon]
MAHSLSDEELYNLARKARRHIIEMVHSARSGHPGGSLSIIDILIVLYFRELNVSPSNPDDPHRDRLILSKGHASPGLYAALALKGFIPEDSLKGFRKLASKLEGHVHYGIPGVEASTGSLGQGLGIGVGLALASRLDALDNHIFVILGDGEIEEGSVWESLMAGHKFRLGNLIAILDRNGVQLDGFTEDIMPMMDIRSKVESFGWNVLEIDGHSVEEITAAIESAKRQRDIPTFIIARTVKGKGVSYMENNPKYHGSPPESEEMYQKALSEIGDA